MDLEKIPLSLLMVLGLGNEGCVNACLSFIDRLRHPIDDRSGNESLP